MTGSTFIGIRMPREEIDELDRIVSADPELKTFSAAIRTFAKYGKHIYQLKKDAELNPEKMVEFVSEITQTKDADGISQYYETLTPSQLDAHFEMIRLIKEGKWQQRRFA